MSPNRVGFFPLCVLKTGITIQNRSTKNENRSIDYVQNLGNERR